MPFTATHIAAVVPVAWLCRWRLPLSALAIGSMVPDAAGFYPSLLDYDATHSFQGVITHCLPLGLIGFFLFHLVLKQPLVDLLPAPLSHRLAGWSRSQTDLHPVRILVVMVCVAFGAWTHVVWDSFTHSTGWGVTMFPSLTRVVTSYGGQSIHGYSMLQHASSLLLLPPLTVGFLWWVLRQPVSDATRRERLKLPTSVSLPAAAMIAAGGWIYFHSILSNQVDATWVAALRATVKDCGAIVIGLLVLYCLGMHLAWWYAERQPLAEPPVADFEPAPEARLISADSAHEVVRSPLSHSPRRDVTTVDAGRSPGNRVPS